MTEHYDLGIVGWWYGDNYGSMLTYHALHSILTSFGYSVAMIPHGFALDENPILPDTPPIRFAYQTYNVVDCRPASAMYELNDLFDGFICGSDQLWNPTIPIVDSENFLAFASDDKRLLSYATSFGDYILDDRWRKPVITSNIQNLRRFDAVSVREDYGVNIAREVFGVDAVSVVDPVFLADRLTFDSVADTSTISRSGEYLFAFILDPTPEKRQSVEAVARKLGLDSIVVMTGADVRTLQICRDVFFNHHVIDEIDLGVFLNLLRSSAYVVTDSFHGTCFAWIYRRPFSSIVNEQRGGDRFRYLFRFLDLKERELRPGLLLEEVQKDPNVSMYMDFDRGKHHVMTEIQKSRTWLRNALGTPVRVRGTDLLRTRRILDIQSPQTVVKLETNWKMMFGDGSVFLDMPEMENDLRDQYWRIVLDELMINGQEYFVEISLKLLEGSNSSLTVAWSNSTTGEEAPIYLEGYQCSQSMVAPFDKIDSISIRVAQNPNEHVRVSIEKISVSTMRSAQE